MELQGISKEFQKIINWNQDSDVKNYNKKDLEDYKNKITWKLTRQDSELGILNETSAFIPLKKLLESANKYIFKDFYIEILMPKDITDREFAILGEKYKSGEQKYGQLKGRMFLDISCCNSITDKAFESLKGIHTLNMTHCKKITDEAFLHLEGIHTLNMGWCNQTTITDKAFLHLKGIHELYMWGCNQDKITDKAFLHLEGIHTLNMGWCDQTTITDKAFSYLKGIHTLDMSNCIQITDEAFLYLKEIHTLNIENCNQITDKAYPYLVKIPDLSLPFYNENFYRGFQTYKKKFQEQQNTGISICRIL